MSALQTTALPGHLCPCDPRSYPTTHGHTPAVPTARPLPRGPGALLLLPASPSTLPCGVLAFPVSPLEPSSCEVGGWI